MLVVYKKIVNIITKGVIILETKLVKTHEAIRQEYANKCCELGDRSYRIKLIEKEISDIYKKLAELEEEAKALPPEVKTEIQLAKESA